MTDDDSTDDERNGYAVYHLPEAAAERAVERFKRKAARIEAGADDVAASGTVYLQDTLHDEASDGPVTFLIDGEPLGSWLNGRVDRMKIEADDE